MDDQIVTMSLRTLALDDYLGPHKTAMQVRNIMLKIEKGSSMRADTYYISRNFFVTIGLLNLL